MGTDIGKLSQNVQTVKIKSHFKIDQIIINTPVNIKNIQTRGFLKPQIGNHR